MYDLCHPSYYNISKLGCIDGTKITIAFYVYIELCEVKRLWDVEYKYNKEIDIIYIEGKKSRTSMPETYIPWPTLYKISLVQIENIQQILNIERFTFVFKGGDSTSVYYRVTAGLVKPIPPEHSKLIKQKEDKKQELEHEIRRNTSILYELARSIDSNERKTEENENEECANLSNCMEELPDKISENKEQETKDHETIEEIKDEANVKDTKYQEEIHNVKYDENIESVDSDVEMIFETK